MRIARMLAPVHSLGPGNRVCIWTQGCSKNCKGCISPEMQPAKGEEIDEELLSNIIINTAIRSSCDGLTISGGDPFEQSRSLLRLLKILRPHFSDVLIYTGYYFDEIRSGCIGEEAVECLDYIDVLIDGPYVDLQNVPNCVLRGSENQKINYITGELQSYYEKYIGLGRQLESFTHNSTIVITGIMNRKEISDK